jgi:hypothetical protein
MVKSEEEEEEMKLEYVQRDENFCDHAQRKTIFVLFFVLFIYHVSDMCLHIWQSWKGN